MSSEENKYDRQYYYQQQADGTVHGYDSLEPATSDEYIKAITQVKQNKLKEIEKTLIEEHDEVYKRIKIEEAQKSRFGINYFPDKTAIDNALEFNKNIDKKLKPAELTQEEIQLADKLIKEDEGIRLNEGKVPLNCIPHSAILSLGRVFGKNIGKYPKDNYRKGMAWSKIVDSLERHLLRFVLGEDIDSEDGLRHVDKLLANAAILAEYAITCPEKDDRYKYTKEQIDQMLEYLPKKEQK